MGLSRLLPRSAPPRSEPAAAEPPLEIKRIRLAQFPELCSATPLYVAEELLKGEFQGMDTITVEVKEVAEKKQLCFHGSKGDAPAEPEPVGAGAGT